MYCSMVVVVVFVFCTGAWRVQFSGEIRTRLCVCMCCLRQFIYCCSSLLCYTYTSFGFAHAAVHTVHSQRTAFLLCYRFFLESCLFDDWQENPWNQLSEKIVRTFEATHQNIYWNHHFHLKNCKQNVNKMHLKCCAFVWNCRRNCNLVPYQRCTTFLIGNALS